MSPDDSLEIPPQVQHVKLGRGLKHVLTAVPSTIKSIISPAPWSDNMVFGEYTEPQDTKSLLNSTTNLHLHGVKYHSFNSFIVPQTLGNNIKSISFGHCFNQVILPGTFPNSVEFLDFGHSFNQPLHKSLLPSSLQTLVLGRGFKQDLKDVFPSTLTQLSLHLFWVSAVQSISQFPPNLIKLSIPYYDGVLGIIPTTTTLVHLELNQVISNFGKFPGDADADIIPIELVPPNITTLILNEYMRIQSYDLIPLTIKNIKLCDSIRPGTKIPITIESVVLPKSFNSPLGTILQTVDNCDQ
ncbi:hypothetical protein CYY_010046 [Polysphondylium violaceum]|uniref:FNIP repeat-containing protein n=1 Tax=Polysphondylium violaceum TaxID=133409 RepID=A0A8J4PM00_9MYCE|nr:hypothetical protein CYY_010046 [Polysphondylium violaceum]